MHLLCLANASSLTHLNLEGIIQLTDELAERILESCQSLKRLSLPGLKHLSPTTLRLVELTLKERKGSSSHLE